MTTLELFAYIVIGITVQIAGFSLVAFYRHWQNYQALKQQLAGFDGGVVTRPVPPEPRPEAHGSPPAWSGFRTLRVTRKVFEDRERSVCSFELAPADGKPLPRFLPGQFLTFRLDAGETGGKGVIRCYSLSDRPGLDHFRISVKRVIPPGPGSGHLHDHVREGDLLETRAPSGHFFLEPGSAPVVLVAGGIGITPMISMINDNVEQGREMWLFYGVRHSGEHPFKEHLETLAATHANFRLRVCYSRPLAGDLLGRDFHQAGHVDITLLRLSLFLRPYHFYICGPAAMLESMVPALEAWGVPEAHVHYEAFGPASLAKKPRPAPAGEAPVTTPPMVTFQKSGRTLPWDERAGSLLEFAEQHGIAVDSGCRAGGCGTCQTRIVTGEVDYNQEHDFDAEPGSCLMCIARPRRDLTVMA